jgi:N-hydroxyarylamine O-acetyltransferase
MIPSVLLQVDQTLPKLAEYLKRIGYTGTARPDFNTLRELQRVHVRTVPFENLDVQLRRPVGLDVDAGFEKIVRQRRGGWCFELNGLLGWALREIGFDVMRLSAGVMRERFGDSNLGNHLCLLVRIDRPYLVDVGFGGSLSEPLPLDAAAHLHPPYSISLTEAGAGYWRFTERAGGEPFSFDFRIAAADESLFAEKCTELQTSPASPFIQNLVAQQRFGDRHVSLRGRVLKSLHETGEQKTILASADELVATLRDKFNLDVPEVATLWPAICARHDQVFASG